MGVRCGLEGIPEALRRPIHDILICSSVIGSLNISDIPQGADYIARLAAAVAGWELPEPWREILNRKHTGCHFEYPGSTFGLRIRAMSPEQAAALGSLCGDCQNPALSDISTCGDRQSQATADDLRCQNQEPPAADLRNTDSDAHTGTRALLANIPQAGGI